MTTAYPTLDMSVLDAPRLGLRLKGGEMIVDTWNLVTFKVAPEGPRLTAAEARNLAGELGPCSFALGGPSSWRRAGDPTAWRWGDRHPRTASWGPYSLMLEGPSSLPAIWGPCSAGLGGALYRASLPRPKISAHRHLSILPHRQMSMCAERGAAGEGLRARPGRAGGTVIPAASWGPYSPALGGPSSPAGELGALASLAIKNADPRRYAGRWAAYRERWDLVDDRARAGGHPLQLEMGL